MRIDIYRRISKHFLFKTFGVILFLLALTTFQSTPTLAQQACEVYPGHTITCPVTTSCYTISGQKTCYPDRLITPSVSVPAPTSIDVIPTVLPTGNIVVDNCQHALGDANCDFSINLIDFEQWRKEFTGEATTKLADFDGDGSVTVADFEIWRRTYFAATQAINNPLPMVPTTSPTAGTFDLSTCTITATAGGQVINGTDGNDVICVLSSRNVVNGFGGNDIIQVNGASNYIDAGAGNDTIIEGPSAQDDYILGGDGDDTIDASSGKGGSNVDGGAGNNTCRITATDIETNCQQ